MSPAPPPQGAPGLDYTDPPAVAGAYVTTRFTYQAADAAGYADALSAPLVTTADFSARSVPTADQVGQAQRAQDASAVQITSVTPSAEAPSDASSQYVSVGFTTVSTYVGSPADGQRSEHLWSLHLVAVDGRWLVDAITVGDQ